MKKLILIIAIILLASGSMVMLHSLVFSAQTFAGEILFAIGIIITLVMEFKDHAFDNMFTGDENEL